ncbi:MFS transporter [Streptomyces sp. NPDC014734]|uniref:MFS transporter n=1 Tax=Streptomyces sp. NPDC014734 TaxID=3364886 RepID=UPI0036F50835
MLPHRNASLWAVAASYGLSSMGDQMAVVSLTLRFHDQGRSGAMIAALVVAGVIPVVVVGPLAGPLVDRVDGRRLIVTVAALQALAATGTAVVEDAVTTIGLLVLLGAGTALASPALQLLVPRLTGDGHTARGYARLEAFRTGGNVAGPALAGLLVAATDERVALLVDAATFAVVAAVFLFLPVPGGRGPSGGRDAGWAAQVRRGVGVLVGDRLLRTAIAALACAIVFTAVLGVARVFFVRDDLHASDAGYGWLVTAHTTGMLLSSLLLAPRIPLSRQPRVLVGAGILMGVALFTSARVPVFPVVLVAFVLTGVANSLQGLAIRNLVHDRVPPEVRGRAFASSGAVLNGANLVGTALGGPAAGLLGGAGALQLAGAGTLLATLAAAPALVRRPDPGTAAGGARPAGTNVVEATDER